MKTKDRFSKVKMTEGFVMTRLIVAHTMGQGPQREAGDYWLCECRALLRQLYKGDPEKHPQYVWCDGLRLVEDFYEWTGQLPTKDTLILMADALYAATTKREAQTKRSD